MELTDKKDGFLGFRVRPSKSLKKYFNSDTFFIGYDRPVDGVDESILYIPVIANIAPVAWATGADIHVKALDGTFVKALGTIRRNIKDMFPGFSCEGEVRVGRTVNNHFGHRGSAQLFTGGVDSMATYAMHRGEKPDIFYLEIFKPYSKLLQDTVTGALSRFAEKEGVAFHRVDSNLNYAFFNQRNLLADFGQYIHEPSWWASVQHGLGLLGMCAPLTALCDIRRIYIASSATKSKSQGPGRPWGSHPRIDGNVAWADVNAMHDGIEYSRQEKIRNAIKPYIESAGDLPLIVCDDPRRGSLLNCGRCEKCSRTIVGLALEGIDPNRCGFKADGRTFDNIRRKLLWSQLMFAKKKTGAWEDIRDSMPGTIDVDLYGSKAFFEWLRGHEFFEAKNGRPSLYQKLLQICLRLGLIP